MRKPRRKLLTLLVGSAAVVLVAVAAFAWKDIYCHLFLDPRLVGRWEEASIPATGTAEWELQLRRPGGS